eukprot:UN1332
MQATACPCQCKGIPLKSCRAGQSTRACTRRRGAGFRPQTFHHRIMNLRMHELTELSTRATWLAASPPAMAEMKMWHFAILNIPDPMVVVIVSTSMILSSGMFSCSQSPPRQPPHLMAPTSRLMWYFLIFSSVFVRMYLSGSRGKQCFNTLSYIAR